VYYPLKTMTRQEGWNDEQRLYPCDESTCRSSAIAEAACATSCVVAADAVVAVAGQRGSRAGLDSLVFPFVRRASSFFDICGCMVSTVHFSNSCGTSGRRTQKRAQITIAVSNGVKEKEYRKERNARTYRGRTPLKTAEVFHPPAGGKRDDAM
jgi:hypothetical protein